MILFLFFGDIEEGTGMLAALKMGHLSQRLGITFGKGFPQRLLHGICLFMLVIC